ncbi:MAG: LCP family protein [Clostridiales Family XIII bacterium]|jgi:LCP family protein required for cell wall assembly|nr:LCP family protein [Clostridiales Family XIII bacterium]
MRIRRSRRTFEESTKIAEAAEQQEADGNLAGGDAAADKKNARHVFGTTFLIGLLVFIVLLVPAAFGLAGLSDAPVMGGEDEVLPDEITSPVLDPEDPRSEMFQRSKRVNILLLGVNGGLTDTIMLGSYDMENQKADIISIPRDTYYEREEATTPAQRKINAIYYKGRAIGTAEAVKEVLTGMPIHYYAVVDYKAVEKAVDSINGVTVNIPINMDYDDEYDKPALHIHFQKGEKLLSGADAIKFLRFRKNNNGGGYPDQDIGRTRAQQEFMKAAFKKSIGLNLPKVVSTVMENVESDLTVGAAAKLAVHAAQLDPANIENYTLPGKSSTVNGASYWFVDEDAVRDIVDGIYGVLPEPEPDADAESM